MGDIKTQGKQGSNPACLSRAGSQKASLLEPGRMPAGRLQEGCVCFERVTMRVSIFFCNLSKQNLLGGKIAMGSSLTLVPLEVLLGPEAWLRVPSLEVITSRALAQTSIDISLLQRG